MNPSNFCPGKYRPCETQTWYFSKEKPYGKVTYCQFCVNFGCISKDNLEEVPSNTCNCDCPNTNAHLKNMWQVIPYVCESCAHSEIDAKNTEHRKCLACSRNINWGTNYCDYCSSKDAHCLICGTAVEPDNSYWDKYSSLKAIIRTQAKYVSGENGMMNLIIPQTDGKNRIIYSQPS
jgi:predicted nucleic acid-binding Zn ribbon protein